MEEMNLTSKLEMQLKAALNPVNPHNDFVSELQDRLKKNTLIAIEKPDYLVAILFVLSGLILGAVGFFLLKFVFRPLKKKT